MLNIPRPSNVRKKPKFYTIIVDFNYIASKAAPNTL